MTNHLALRTDRSTRAFPRDRRGRPAKVSRTGGEAMLFDETLSQIGPLDDGAVAAARALHARLTKPAGSLGALEALSVRLAGLAGVCPPPLLEPAALAVFAGDHGVHAQGVTPWPQEVTAQMVANF